MFGGSMIMIQKEIDELYSRLNIKNEGMIIRTHINEGTLNNKLNTNRSVICSEQRCTEVRKSV